MPEPDFLAAALPLFAADAVDAVVWGFDTGWGPTGLPEWLRELLASYSAAGRLYGHGVHYSVLSGEWGEREETWLACLRLDQEQRRYQHVSEHFGFCSGGDFHRSAPLPVPFTPETLALGQARLARLAAVVDAPVGLENLALAFSAADVAVPGRFLDELLAPVDGFLLLDLHNLYCQLCNFECDADTLLAGYPLHRVRELHVSGGSWREAPSAPGRRIRRDTHDEAVPDAVFDLVTAVIPRCPNLQLVTFERLGGTLTTPTDASQLHADFHRLRDIVAAAS
jgi:uncharacterized protein (UPF0276 family)